MTDANTDSLDDRRALTIAEFCAQYAISVRSFYNNEAAMPPTIRMGRRRVILVVSLPAWERERLRNADSKRKARAKAA